MNNQQDKNSQPNKKATLERPDIEKQQGKQQQSNQNAQKNSQRSTGEEIETDDAGDSQTER